jgi:hypothetical protein
MQGKSIGFLTLEASPPTEAEVKARPDWEQVRRVIRKCLLLEGACLWLPVNPQAVTEAVSKGLATRDELVRWGLDLHPAAPPHVIPFRTEEAVAASVRRHLAGLSAVPPAP